MAKADGVCVYIGTYSSKDRAKKQVAKALDISTKELDAELKKATEELA